jgi:N-acetylglucosamine kinase-like BadF-type ATPase
MAELFLGIDGGQSSTTALIGDAEGKVLGMGRGGPCNHVKTGDGRAKFTGAIGGCVGKACSEAGLDPATVRFVAAGAGFSGGPADKDALLREIVKADEWLITNDALIALTGATNGAPGIITISGTGSISFGRNGAGNVARAGGWGYVYGDEGGGFDLTRQALRAGLRQHEGWGPATKLHDKLLAATGAAEMNDLLHRFYTTDWPRPEIAKLSRLVDEAAIEGDAVACQILETAALRLAEYTNAVRRQLFQPGEPARVAWIGGVFKSRLLRERFAAEVEREAGNSCGDPIYGPAAGALLEAYRLAGCAVSLSGVPREKSDTI